MKLFITLAIASFGVIGVLCRWEERGEELGGGGYHSRGSVIGLSRGIEVGRHRIGSEEERRREMEEERHRWIGGEERRREMEEERRREMEERRRIGEEERRREMEEERRRIGEEERHRWIGGEERRKGLGEEWEREREREGRREEHYGIGWGGSHFITPVDVHREEVVHLKARPEYRYDYRVNDHRTKDLKDKEEVRDGYRVKGRYSLLEPDRKTVRVVDYTSDKKRGFVAKVSWRRHD